MKKKSNKLSDLQKFESIKCKWLVKPVLRGHL
jgi:hypothetical protein